MAYQVNPFSRSAVPSSAVRTTWRQPFRFTSRMSRYVEAYAQYSTVYGTVSQFSRLIHLSRSPNCDRSSQAHLAQAFPIARYQPYQNSPVTSMRRSFCAARRVPSPAVRHIVSVSRSRRWRPLRSSITLHPTSMHILRQTAIPPRAICIPPHFHTSIDHVVSQTSSINDSSRFVGRIGGPDLRCMHAGERENCRCRLDNKLE